MAFYMWNLSFFKWTRTYFNTRRTDSEKYVFANVIHEMKVNED